MSEERADYLKELKVTAAEVAELKETWQIAAGQSERNREILKAAKKAGDIRIFWPRDGGFHITDLCSLLFSDRCYRLRPDLELPAEPAKREGDAPFTRTVDGAEVWCCPVVRMKAGALTELRFYLPVNDGRGGAWGITQAAGFLEFLGVMTADESGWPKDWIQNYGCIENRMDTLLADRDLTPWAFVCFRKN